MNNFGVTDDGFLVKGIDVILRDAFTRAKTAFGDDVDLTSTSPLRKIIEVAALEDAELWKRLEGAYYATFVSTASGDSLDLLGDDVGLPRRRSPAVGEVTLTLSNGVPGRTYLVGDATALLTTSVPALTFTTDAAVTLSAAAPTAMMSMTCMTPGAIGNVAASTITAIDPAYLAVYFPDLGTATIAVTNPAPCSGGGLPEADDAYRGRQIGISRSLWTVESVRQAVLDVPGVVDVVISDPLGGADVSQSYFNLFDFGERLFSAERRIGEPYRFDVVVAHDFRWPWQPLGSVPGLEQQTSAAIDTVRPVGIHPNIIEADHIDIGVRARVLVEPGYDAPALLTHITDRIRGEAAGLRLGSNVLSSQVMRAFTDESGVIDVQALHLRRAPAAFGRVTLGGVAYQTAVIEAAIGDNLVMGPTELAVFRADSPLNAIDLVLP